jgi:hypothetical protein
MADIGIIEESRPLDRVVHGTGRRFAGYTKAYLMVKACKLESCPMKARGSAKFYGALWSKCKTRTLPGLRMHPAHCPLVGILQSSFFIEKVIASYFNQHFNFNFYCVNVENVTAVRSFGKGTF